MKAIEIKPQVYWVGAKDWNLREFHGYKTQKGTSYNAYLIVDEKVVLVDTVKPSLSEEMMGRIRSVIDPSKIDYIVCNHGEMDHSGAIPKMAKLAPKAEILISPQGEKILQAHFHDPTLNLRTVAPGEVLKIGKRSLQFFHTPMVHWPDSMITYMAEDQLLFSNDSFGQHIALDVLFTSESPKEIYMYEAKKYFANIVYPYTTQVLKALSALEPLSIDMIAPSHGVIWDENIEDILNRYKSWASSESKEQAVIVYDTMWGSTEKLANVARSAFEEMGIRVTLRSLSHEHYSDVMADLLEARYVLIGSSIINSEILPSVGAFLTYLKGLRPKNKVGFVFGSYGWAKKGLVQIEEIAKGLHWDLPCESFFQQYVPTSEDCEKMKSEVLRLGLTQSQ